MFTGIVQGVAEVISLQKKNGLLSFSVMLPAAFAANISLGASIAINGVCLTVTTVESDGHGAEVFFDVIQQSLELTNLSSLTVGASVNFERSATLGTEIGGHVVSGHIDTTAKIVAIASLENNQNLRFSFPPRLNKYLFDKGFVCLNGCSLTIAAIDHMLSELTVSFIPETLRATTFSQLSVGDSVNLEIERHTQAVVDTVERVLAARS
jgi:riboflavin synthase